MKKTKKESKTLKSTSKQTTQKQEYNPFSRKVNSLNHIRLKMALEHGIGAKYQKIN